MQLGELVEEEALAQFESEVVAARLNNDTVCRLPTAGAACLQPDRLQTTNVFKEDHLSFRRGSSTQRRGELVVVGHAASATELYEVGAGRATSGAIVGSYLCKSRISSAATNSFTHLHIKDTSEGFLAYALGINCR